MEAVLEKEELIRIEGNAEGVRHLVMEGYRQAMQGKTKNFYSVCDRLAERFYNAAGTI